MWGTGGWGGCQYIVKLSILGLRHPPTPSFQQTKFSLDPPPHRIFSRLAHAYSLYKKNAFETDIPYNPQCFVRYSKYSRIFLKCLKVLPITLVTEFKINTNSDIFNIYEINQINWDMKICCPKNNWISFDWIFKKYHAHSNYICTDLEGFASEKFKLFKSHSKISKKRPWTPPPPNFQEGFVWSRQDIKFISFSSKQATEFKTKLKFPDLLRVEPVQDSEDTLTNIANIYHRKFVSYY